MSLQTRTLGGSTGSPFTSQASGTDYLSALPLDTTGSNVSGAYISGAFTALRPVMFSRLEVVFSSGSASVDLQIATANTGSGGYQSSAVTASGTVAVTPNLSAFTGDDFWYGFQKNDSGTVTYRRGGTGNIYEDGSIIYSGDSIGGEIQWKTAPNAPTGFSSTAQTTSSVTLGWTKPTDLGGSSVLSGYRVLYKKSSSSTWLTTGKIGTNTSVSTTVSGLEPGTAYDFRIAATNETTDDINSSYTSIAAHTGTNSSQISATTLSGMKVRNAAGTGWDSAVVKVRNSAGTGWDVAVVKVRNTAGTGWDNVQ